MDTVNVAGIPTHRPVDITIASDLTGPPARSLKMPTHAADHFEAGIADELGEAADEDQAKTKEAATRKKHRKALHASMDAQNRQPSTKTQKCRCR